MKRKTGDELFSYFILHPSSLIPTLRQLSDQFDHQR
jgi:hypothetical protein